MLALGCPHQTPHSFLHTAHWATGWQQRRGIPAIPLYNSPPPHPLGHNNTSWNKETKKQRNTTKYYPVPLHSLQPWFAFCVCIIIDLKLLKFGVRGLWSSVSEEEFCQVCMLLISRWDDVFPEQTGRRHPEVKKKKKKERLSTLF